MRPSAKRVCLWALVAILSGSLGAFAAEPVTVIFPVRSGEGPFWEEVARIFNAQSDDVKVQTEMQSGDWFAYVEKIQIMVSSGVSPDIVTTALPSMAPLLAGDLLTDLTPFLERGTIDPNRFFPGVLDFLRTDGKLVLLPIGMTTTVAIVNEQHFAYYGVALPSRSWRETWTWREFEEGATALTQVENGRLRSAAYEYYNSPTTYFPFIWGNGGAWVREGDGIPRVALKETATVEALEFLRNVMEIQASPLAALESPGANFERGNVAVRFTGAWWITPERHSMVNFSVYPLPLGRTGPVTSIATNPVGILKTAKNPEAAWKFFEWLHTPEGSEYFSQTGGFGVPVYRPTVDAHADKIFGYLAKEDLGAILESMNYLRSEGVGPAFNELFNIFRDGFTAAVVRREIPISEFVENAEQRSNAVLREAYSR